MLKSVAWRMRRASSQALSSAVWLTALAIAVPSVAIASELDPAHLQAQADSDALFFSLIAQDPAASSAQLEAIQGTNDGFFLRTTGSVPVVETPRQRDSRRLTFFIPNGELSPRFNPNTLPQDINGVSQWIVTEREQGGLEVTLELLEPNVVWQASASPFGGVVVIPVSGRSNIAEFRTTDPDAALEEEDVPVVIQSLEISPEGLLIVEGDRPLTVEESWDRRTANYRIAIPNAELAPGVSAPNLPDNSPLLRVSVDQDGEEVVILAQPAAGVFVLGVTLLADQRLALELDQSGRRVPLPTDREDLRLPDVSRQGAVVVIDPGHGGVDPGAVGINGLREIDVAFPISLEVAALLEEQGVRVVLTRTDDRTLDLAPRVQIAERANADLFVSIHANAISMSRPDVNGAETYYASARGRVLAQAIQSNLIAATGMRDRGVKSARFYVLVNTSMPAALVEVGFVTGAEDAPRLADPGFRSVLAEAIAKGILEYVQQNL